MSFVIINGREVEILEPEKEELYPDFLERKLVSPKKVLFADNSGNIHMTCQEKTFTPFLFENAPEWAFSSAKSNVAVPFGSILNAQRCKKPIIRRRPGHIIEQVSILGKRKLIKAFGLEIYNDKERYGQDIPSDFFKTNIGHGVI